MRIIFMGSPDFAIPSLEKLCESSHEIAAVVSNVDKRRGRGSSTSPTPVKKRALKLNLPVIEADDLSEPSFLQKVRAYEPELFVVVAFRILPEAALEIPAKGSVNLHASLLPRYRGAAPIHWAVMNGEHKTGCTIFFLDENVDTGKIVMQRETAIGQNETTGDVYDRLKVMGSDLLMEAVDKIEQDLYEARPQKHTEATPAPKLYTEDCKIDFDASAQSVHNKIRGLSPFPAAWARLDGLKFNMYRSRVGPDIDLKPGELVFKEESLLVGCRSGSVILEEVQIEGKRKMTGEDFMNGYSGTAMVH